MTAAELIEKLKGLDPDAPITVEKEGCGCCEGYQEQAVALVRMVEDGRFMVVCEEEV